MKSFSIHDNPFTDLYIDITTKCNMRCGFCYNPHYNDSYMDVEYFDEVCKQLPNKVFMRFLGGEPTLHPKLTDLLRIADRYGHKVWIASNGLMYDNVPFMVSLLRLKPELKSGLSLGLTMDGGITNELAYIRINNGNYLRKKLKALNNLVEMNLGRVSLSAIIVRGLNENVIPELIDVARKNSSVIRAVHFRTAGLVGKFDDTIPYTGLELKELVHQYFTEDQFKPRCVGEIHCSADSPNTCCYRFRPFNRVQISIVEFATEQSSKCPYRGRLSDNGLIQPFFENVIQSTTLI